MDAETKGSELLPGRLPNAPDDSVPVPRTFLYAIIADERELLRVEPTAAAKINPGGAVAV
jgi:hypothetical protein